MPSMAQLTTHAGSSPIYAKTYHATHPEMMDGVTTRQLRDGYRIGDLLQRNKD